MAQLLHVNLCDQVIYSCNITIFDEYSHKVHTILTITSINQRVETGIPKISSAYPLLSMILHVAQLHGQETVAGGTKGSTRRQKMAKTEGHLRCNGARVASWKSFKKPSLPIRLEQPKGWQTCTTCQYVGLQQIAFKPGANEILFRSKSSYFNACRGYRIKEREGFPHCSWHV